MIKEPENCFINVKLPRGNSGRGRWHLETRVEGKRHSGGGSGVGTLCA